MAKKKRKHRIKLNNAVRKLFDGHGFDEAVTTLPDDLLIELTLLVDAQPESLERATLIRTLRRLWSEGDISTRKQIVDFLQTRYHRTGTPDSREGGGADTDRVASILALLAPHDPTPQEEEAILEAFADAPPTPQTHDAILAALHQRRRQERLERFVAETDIHLTPTRHLELYHPFRFRLPEHDFTKTLRLLSPDPIPDALLDADDETIRAYAADVRDTLVAQMQAHVDAFVGQLFVRPHPWLTPEQIETFLRRMPPEVALHHAPIDFMVCEQIVRRIDPDARLIASGETFIIEKNRTVALRGTPIPYRIQTRYDRSFLYGTIWRGEPLPVLEDLEAVDRELLRHFEVAIHDLLERARTMAEGLGIDEATIWEQILPHLQPQLIQANTLTIQGKTLRRILYHFDQYLQPIREAKRREELLANTIRDFKRLFPLARERKRRILFHAGPTNSGKTYTAMEQLRQAQTGYYLAPLRLLALEGYESLREHGVAASLITGEEEILHPHTTHVSSTIEMLNFEAEVDCCVIDEIQMIADRDRGWAWANALIGAPARTLILTGSEDAIDAVERLARYLNEPLEIIHFERKNPLEVMRQPVPLKKVKPLTAVVAFSRKEVLSLKQRLTPRHRVSVIYGNLSPEVRREEARKFREGDTDVLVATDAIAMGLNLPIRTLLFARDNKFDGLRRRELTASEILQIAGRSGRYGYHEHGYVGALDAPTLETIQAKFHRPLPPIELPVSVMASLHHVLLIGEILQTDDLLEILTFFAKNMEFDGPFRAANIESMLEIAAIVGEYDLDLKARYHLATAPVAINSPYIESVFHRYLHHLERGRSVPYLAPTDLPRYARTSDELLEAEDRVKEVSLYLWLGFRFEGLFPDADAAIASRARLNRYIERTLERGELIKRCRKCGQPLDLSYRYSICERCYLKTKKGFTPPRSTAKKRKNKTSK